MLRPTLFDDYPNEDIGHHASLALGLAYAAHLRFRGPTRLLCPRTYFAGASAPPYAEFHACEGPRPYTPRASRDNVAEAARRAEDDHAGFVFNLFLDENFESFEDLHAAVPYAHVLHRPGPEPRGPESGRPVLDWLSGRRRDLVVVHTHAGVRLACELAPAERVVRSGWPTSSRDDLLARFAGKPPLSDEPHVLMVGGARLDKGIRCLLEAVEGGPEVRVVGEQAAGLREHLEAEYPRARVRWDIKWAPKAALDDAIAAASVCVFPYLVEFARHGGASGALAQTLTHPAPVIVSSNLADQVPHSDACVVVPSGDSGALKAAISRALQGQDDIRAAAFGHLDFALAEHTYEGHLERILERIRD